MPLARLLEARSQLRNLLTYMDGKTDAEKLVARLLEDRALMSSLAASPKPGEHAETQDTE